MFLLNRTQKENATKLRGLIIGKSTSELESVKEGINTLGSLMLEEFKLEGNMIEYDKTSDNIRVLLAVVDQETFNVKSF